jgi:uncharacterized protein
MRLSSRERLSIKQAVHEVDPSAQVLLYGSRADDSLKGGDIDLLVISDSLGFSDKISILSRIKEQIGEQKIDLLIKTKTESSSDPFVLRILPRAAVL